MIFKMYDSGIFQIDGINYPAVGFGTYPLKGDACFKAILQAAELGYRIMDTATFYNNFIPIGNALKKFDRKDFYLISKVWPDKQTPTELQRDIESTLTQLQTNYLDAYLLHWPNSQIIIEDTLDKMESFRKNGLIRHIGLSNVNVNHLKRALEHHVPISWVQIEMNPIFYDTELLKFCQEKSIAIQAWAPLARGRLSKDHLLNKLGKIYHKTPMQIALKWIMQHHCVPLPGSQNENHMRQNLDICDFTLSQADMQAIDQQAASGERTRITPNLGLGFTDEFDFTYEQCWPIREHTV